MLSSVTTVLLCTLLLHQRDGYEIDAYNLGVTASTVVSHPVPVSTATTDCRAWESGRARWAMTEAMIFLSG